MNDLKDFQRFAKKTELQKRLEKDVWCYTRVSSIDQKDNYSLEVQRNSAISYAEEKGYRLVNFFGGTYESAKDDFTRKEFTKLIDSIRKAKKKPFGILVYKMSRFSRTGGNGISLVNELVENLGVNLIEVVSDIDTSTPKGQLMIYNKLLTAREENINRLEHTIPGMKSLLKHGKKLGSTPIGFDHYGPKVTDPKRFHYEQKIKVNETGKKLRLAWQWKAEGESTETIIRRLQDLGVKVSKQRLSNMWRNPFFCGIITHKMLDGEIVEGKHEALIDRETFLKVQSIISQNNHGYKVEKQNNLRPLAGTIRCQFCGSKLTGYEVKAKGRHYYKCGHCKGVSINADTSVRMNNRKGAHNLFIDHLQTYQLEEKYLELFMLQMKKIIASTDKCINSEESIYKKQLTELQNRKDKLEERFAFGEIEQSLYTKFICQTDDQITNLKAKFDFSGIDTSNLKSNLNKAVDFTQNVSKYWVSGNLDQRQRIQKLVFPQGIIIDTQKRQYLTSKVNALFAVKRSFTNNNEYKTEGLPTVSGGES